MFLGEYQHTLDAKGRVSLPAKFRAEMTGSLVVAKGFEECLYVFPAEEYAGFLKSVLERNDFDRRFRDLRRYFTAGAVEVELDSAGRINLPPNAREHAGLGKDVSIIGNGERVEIWDVEKWAKYNGETAADIENLAKELADASLL